MSDLQSPFDPFETGGTGGGFQEVGDFRQGSPASRWALARYLVGRAVVDYVSRALYVFALIVLALGGLSWWAVSAWLGVPVVLIGFGVLAVRALLAALLRGLSGAAYFGPVEKSLGRLVADTRGDVRRELRRIGLPSRALTLPLLARRLAGRRRAETMARLREFDLDGVVSSSRLDELHLLMRQAGVIG